MTVVHCALVNGVESVILSDASTDPPVTTIFITAVTFCPGVNDPAGVTTASDE